VYRTRFLVKARQLTVPLAFVDALGREQRGRPGDYLVEAADGSRSIQRRQIFEDIYVAMATPDESVSQLKMLQSQPESQTTLQSQPQIFAGSARVAPESAAKRRQNKAHAATRGSEEETLPAPQERKSTSGRLSLPPTSPRRSTPEHKERVSTHRAATA